VHSPLVRWKLPSISLLFRNEPEILGGNVVYFRLYNTALTLTFLLLVMLNRGLGILEGTVIVSSVLFLILDTKIDHDNLKALEAEVTALTKGAEC
jgi:hypothetical protein